jgi:hypothetical protein
MPHSLCLTHYASQGPPGPEQTRLQLLYLHVRTELCVVSVVKSLENCSASILGLFFLHHLYFGPEGLSGF